MLHAPPSETKTETAQSKSQSLSLPERERYPHQSGTRGQYGLNGVGNATFIRSPEAQRRQILAGLQTTHGNQAVLRMLQSSQQVARIAMLRPSQSVMLQRKCACGSSSEAEGECAECKAKREGELHSELRGSSPVVLQQGPPQPQAQPQAQRPGFGPDCNQYRRCLVIEPLVHAKQLVDAVLKELPPIASWQVNAGRIVDLLRVHFHTANAADVDTILRNFRRIRAELDAAVRYVCYNVDPATCQPDAPGTEVGAFTDQAPAADVHLCQTYYRLGCQGRARVLVHELAHHVGMRDEAYIGQREYATLTREQAMRNCDSYAEFAKLVFTGNASCANCGDEIQLRGRRY